jgi:nuclease HARBI1
MDFEAFEDMLVENDVVERTVVERPDHFNLFSDTDFYKRYHLKKETVLQLLERIEPLLEADANRNNPISPRLQILATLRILSGCTLQHVCGDLHHIAQSSASRTFSRVVKAICHLRQDFIRMPVNISGVKSSFYEYGGFPGVIACVDGTHIPIIRPKHRAETEVFRCRKGYYSLNVQIVCGPEYLIYDVVARWPGSTHDSRVLENSNIRHYMETANPGLLLADAGYPCRR